MNQKKGRSLEKQLLDSLLEKNPVRVDVRAKQKKKNSSKTKSNAAIESSIPESEAISGSIDLDLGLQKSDPFVKSEAARSHAEISLVLSGEPEPEQKLELGSAIAEPQPNSAAPLSVNEADDRTFSISPPGEAKSETKAATQANTRTGREETVRLRGPRSRDNDEDPSVRVGVGHFVPKQMRSGSGVPSADASLAQSESLRIAQERIVQLETELESVRRENDQLASAGELLRRRADEMQSAVERIQRENEELKKILEEEKSIYKTNLGAKEKDLIEMRAKVDELEMRLENDFKKIRVRERELEHRLELVKMESSSVMRGKDEIILDLKRKIDQLTVETENYRNKGQELYKRLDEKQEAARRVVRALRIALSVIEGEDIESSPLKKVD